MSVAVVTKTLSTLQLRSDCCRPMDSSPIKILIIEDHPIVGNAVCTSVAAQLAHAEFDKVTTLAQAFRLLQAMRNDQHHYSLIVTDLNLPDSSGTDTLRALKTWSQSTPILVLSMDDELQIIQECESLAEKFISKSDASNQFEMAVRDVFENAGLGTQDKSLSHDPLKLRTDHRIDCLTPKQNWVLAELAQGYSNKEIARRLNVSDETVRGHLAEIFRRLGVQNRTQASKYYLLQSYAHRHE